MQPFTHSVHYNNEDVYEIVTDTFHAMKYDGLIEDYVEIEDLYINIDGDVYAVEHYITSYFSVEGHGMHTLVEADPDLRSAVLVITSQEVLSQLHPEVFYNINVA